MLSGQDKSYARRHIAPCPDPPRARAQLLEVHGTHAEADGGSSAHHEVAALLHLLVGEHVGVAVPDDVAQAAAEVVGEREGDTELRERRDAGRAEARHDGARITAQQGSAADAPRADGEREAREARGARGEGHDRELVDGDMRGDGAPSLFHALRVTRRRLVPGHKRQRLWLAAAGGAT